VKTRCLQEGGRSLGAKISGVGVIPGEYFLVSFDKIRHILLSDSANCTVLCAVIQYRHVMDRQTDGNAIASTALAMLLQCDHCGAL